MSNPVGVRESSAIPNPSGSRSTIELTVRGFRALPGVASCPRRTGMRQAVVNRSTPIPRVMTEAYERIFIKVSRSVVPAARAWSALEALTSRMIAAMDLRVAVLAGTPDHAWTLSSPQQRTGS